MSACCASSRSSALTPSRSASSSSVGARPSSWVRSSVALRISSSSSWAARRTWTCHRLSRKCRLISPLTHGGGVRGQAVAERRVEVVDRLEQADVADLHQVLDRLGAAAVLPDAGADQLLVPLHDQLAQRRALVAVSRQRAQPGQELVVGQAPELRSVAERGARQSLSSSWPSPDLRGTNAGRSLLCPHQSF